MKASEIASMIDVSAVQAEATIEDIQQSANVAARHGCICVFALPAHTPYLNGLLAGSNTLTGGVVGFPGGSETTSIKRATAVELARMGCAEIDMVNNITWLKAANKKAYIQDIQAVIDGAGNLPVKVILECHWLTNDEIQRACEWSVEAGASWVKTGTGWAPTGATLENVSLMAKTVGEDCGIKAAGGVRNLQTLMAMYERGARRFGIGVKAVESILDEVANIENK
ncbi:MAG: deoxyribose-phosphate aldolase [bacterium]